MNKKSQIKTLLGKIAPSIFGESKVLFSYLYGSYATGEVHSFSDLDIGVYVEEMTTKEQLNLELSLSLKFDEKLSHRVSTEVRIINLLPLVVQGEIITNGILIYSPNEIARVDFETSVRKAYFDFLPVLQQYRRTYMESAVP